MRNLDAIIKAYDVRGTYPDQMNEDLAHDVGAAFVAEAVDRIAAFCRQLAVADPSRLYETE